MLGFKTRDPGALARMRVRRGVRWLNQNGPYRWQCHLLDIREDGNLSFRGRLLFTSGHDSLLGLVFEDRKKFILRGSGGYVSDTTVMRYFKLSQEQCILLGFVADHEYHKLNPREDAMRFALEDAWLEAIRTYARPEHIPYRHDAEATHAASMELSYEVEVDRLWRQGGYHLPESPIRIWLKKALTFLRKDRATV